MPSSNKKHTPTVERRHHHRISSGLEARLTIGLVNPNGTVHAAVPVDICTGGVCLRWPSEDRVVLDVGQRVTLRIHTCTADSPITVQAAVRWTGTDVDGSFRCGLEFADRYEIFKYVMPILWQWCCSHQVQP